MATERTFANMLNEKVVRDPHKKKPIRSIKDLKERAREVIGKKKSNAV